MSRERLTWKDGGAAEVLPVETKNASAHPATPDEGPAHPAAQPDPEANAYENGDTSSWAEDPHPGPYPNSAHPATPDEGPASPAHKAAADQIRVAAERKAAKCIRIASQLFAGLTTEANIIETQAVQLMDLSDAVIDDTLTRLATLLKAAEDKGKEEEEAAAETVQEEAEEEAKEEKEDDKEAKKAADESEEEDADSDKQASEDDALLRRLLAEEGMGTTHEAADDETEAMLRAMLAEEKTAEEEVEEEVEETEAEGSKKADDAETDTNACGPMADEGMGDMAMMVPEEDPMALVDEMSAEEDALLSSLFADSRMAAKKAEDEEEVEEEVEETEAEGSKKATQNPRPKKASTGAQSLGNQTRTASNNEVAELEKLWQSAPDVSSVFGS